MYLTAFLFTLLLQPAPLYIVSPDFANEGTMPRKCTCDGEDIHPTLIVNGIPPETKSLVLIAEDADETLEPLGGWLVWNIPPSETILANTLEGLTGAKAVLKEKYQGPCPETGGSQRYSFKVYAMGIMLPLEADAEKEAVLEAMEGNILAKGELTGIYSRTEILSKKRKKR